MSTKRRLFLLFQLGFGALVAAGAGFEVLNLLVPSLLPELQANPLMRLHHENRVVFFWTLGSNLVTIPIGLVLAGSAVLALRGRMERLRLAKPALLAFVAIMIGAIVVSGRYLVAPGFASGADPAALAVAIAVVSSWFGLATSIGLLAWGHRRMTTAA